MKPSLELDTLGLAVGVGGFMLIGNLLGLAAPHLCPL